MLCQLRGHHALPRVASARSVAAQRTRRPLYVCVMHASSAPLFPRPASAFLIHPILARRRHFGVCTLQVVLLPCPVPFPLPLSALPVLPRQRTLDRPEIMPWEWDCGSCGTAVPTPTVHRPRPTAHGTPADSHVYPTCSPASSGVGLMYPAEVRFTGRVACREGCAFAAALNQLTRSLACEWGPYGIRVNAVAPWFAATPLVRQALQDDTFRAGVLGRTPLQRLADPEETSGMFRAGLRHAATVHGMSTSAYFNVSKMSHSQARHGQTCTDVVARHARDSDHA